ncbi:MAG TPA: hypothetical protein VEC12_09760 [Bacteroidia bacterium]|nr:hypothetical protein [Bacteroidia bacterium]
MAILAFLNYLPYATIKLAVSNRSFFIYVIDDMEGIELLLSSTISEINNQVRLLHSHNGHEALKDISQLMLQPDIILLDLNMPKLDGKAF